jgi:uncharacterized repeat protein (TIGR01451 family)
MIVWPQITRIAKNTCLAGLLHVALASGVAAQCNDATDGYLLDWNAVTYATGSLSQTFTIVRDGQNANSKNADPITATITFSGATNRLQTSMPQSSTQVTGGNAAGSASLLSLVDFANLSEKINIDIVFSRPVDNLNFDIFDVDYNAPTNGTGGYRDDVEITGSTSATGALGISPTLSTPYFTPPPTNVAPSVVYIGDPLPPNHAAGVGASASDSNYGTLKARFNQAVRRVRVTYGNDFITTTDPSAQMIALYDLDFCIQKGATLVTTKTVNVISENITGTFNCATGLAVPTARAFIPGSCIEYVVTVSNPDTGSKAGTPTATDIILSDQLDASLTFVSATATGFTQPAGYAFTKPAAATNCNGSNCLVRMAGASLPVNATATIVIRAVIE